MTVGISRSEDALLSARVGGRDAAGRSLRGIARLPRPAHAGRPRAGRRGGPRLHPLQVALPQPRPPLGSPAGPASLDRRDDKPGRPGRDRNVHTVPALLRTTACGARSTGPQTRGKSPFSKGSRRPHRSDGPGGEGRPGHRYHPSPRPVSPMLRPRQAKAVLQAYQGRYRALVDAVTEAEPRFDEPCSGGSR